MFLCLSSTRVGRKSNEKEACFTVPIYADRMIMNEFVDSMGWISLESLSLSLSLLPLRLVANFCLFLARPRDRLTDIWHCLLPVTVRYSTI